MAPSLYVLVPLTSCLISAVVAAAILVRDPAERANRLAALLVGSASIWALCEVLWNLQSDPEVVIRLVRVSALGWIFLGPLVLDLFLEITGRQPAGVRRALPALYAIAGVFLGIEWLTPWMHPRAVPASWGWGYEVTPLFAAWLVLSVSGAGYALSTAWSAFRDLPTGAERAQARWLAAGMLVPLLVASLTDGVLPMSGVQLPRLGTASFAFLSATIAWSFYRYGHSLLAPGTFAREILETLPAGVATVRLDGCIRGANGAMARLLEAPREDLRGLRIVERFGGPTPDLTQEVCERQCELTTLRGRRLTVSVSSALLRDRRGEPLGSVLAVRDLEEVVSLRNRLALSGRLAAVGELAAGIAHEINNPLAFVSANLGLLRQHWHALAKGEPPEALLAEGEELIDESLEGVSRAAAIVRDVRGLSHAGGGRCELADVNELLDGVVRMASSQLRGRVRVETCYAELPPLPCAPQELQQVFLNLVLNAGQAIGDAGRIRLVTAAESGALIVRVEDDGCGIEPEVVPRIFDPFFTTKPVGEGTGLGLGIAFEIVRRHGGEIRVASEPGRGSCFSVHLPLDADTLPTA